MATIYSSDLKLSIMATGENAGTWGSITNTNLYLLQQAIGGYEAISIAGGAQTTALTMSNGAISNARNAVIKLTGTITGNQIVTVPSGIEKTYIVSNGTTGAFTVEFKTASGTGTTWSTTDKGIKILFADGTNIVDVNANLSEIVLPAGAVGTPALTTSGDLNTGIFFPSADTIAFTEGGTEAMRINSDGSVTKPLQPAFRAKLTSTVSNVTGDGTNYSFAANIWSEIYDQGGNFSPTTGTFTAPVTGIYTFTINLITAGITAGTNNSLRPLLVASNRNTFFAFQPGENRDNFLGGGCFVLTTDVDMDASDTFTFIASVSGGTKIVGFWQDTTLTGHLIC